MVCGCIHGVVILAAIGYALHGTAISKEPKGAGDASSGPPGTAKVVGIADYRALTVNYFQLRVGFIAHVRNSGDRRQVSCQPGHL
jgi:hypothetical protein